MTNIRLQKRIHGRQEGKGTFIAFSIILAMILAFLILLSANFYRVQRVNTKVRGMNQEVATPFIVDEVELCERDVFLGRLWCRIYFNVGTTVFATFTF